MARLCVDAEERGSIKSCCGGESFFSLCVLMRGGELYRVGMLSTYCRCRLYYFQSHLNSFQQLLPSKGHVWSSRQMESLLAGISPEKAVLMVRANPEDGFVRLLKIASSSVCLLCHSPPPTPAFLYSPVTMTILRGFCVATLCFFGRAEAVNIVRDIRR